MMKQIQFVLFFLCFVKVFCQQTITKTIKSDAPYIDINTKGIDNLVIETSASNKLILFIDDKTGLGVVENFICNDFNCVLNISTELKIENPLTNKINQFPLDPPSNVSAILKIPINKKVTILGETIDIQSKGYKGVLRILIDKGKVNLHQVLGVTQVELFTGSVFATIDNNSLDVRTRKGKITLNDKEVKSPLKQKNNKQAQLIISSVNANIVLSSNTQ